MPREQRTFNTLLRVVLTNTRDGYVERLIPDTPDFRSYLFARPRRRGRDIMPVQLVEMHNFLLNANYPESENRFDSGLTHIPVFRGNMLITRSMEEMSERDYHSLIMDVLEHPRHERFGEDYEALRHFKTNIVAVLGFEPRPSSDITILQAADNAQYKITRVVEAPINAPLIDDYELHGPPDAI